MCTIMLTEDDNEQPSAFVTELAAGDSYAPWCMEGPGTWQELLKDPVRHGDDIYLYHVSDRGASPAIFDASTLVRVR